MIGKVFTKIWIRESEEYVFKIESSEWNDDDILLQVFTNMEMDIISIWREKGDVCVCIHMSAKICKCYQAKMDIFKQLHPNHYNSYFINC